MTCRVQPHLYREEVAPWPQEVSDFKFGRQTAVLAVAKQLAIEPGVHRIVYGVKVQKCPAQHKASLIKHVSMEFCLLKLSFACLLKVALSAGHTFCRSMPQECQTSCGSIQSGSRQAHREL